MRQTKLSSQQNGYVALIAVLIIGAVSLAVALTLLSSSTDSQRSALVTRQSMQSRQLATACAEEALQQLHDNTGFVGTNNVSLATGSCAYTVTDIGGSNRRVVTSSTVNNVTRRVQLEASINAPNISINSWQDIP